MPPALTNTVPDAGSTVPSANLHALMATGIHAKWSANCMPLRGSRRPAGPLGTARNANCMHCMPCGHRVPCGHRCAMPTQPSRCPTRIGACYRVGERRSWRSLAVVDPRFDLCVRGLAVRRSVAPGAVRGAGAALDTRPLQGATVEELRLTAEHAELDAPLRLRLLSAAVLLLLLLLPVLLLL